MSAVVVSRKGEVLSVGYNRKRPTRRGHTSVHAEIDAIKKAGWANLKNATLYITRYGNKDCSGVSRLARPCSHCAAVLEKALWEYGLKAVFYTDTPQAANGRKVCWVEWTPDEGGYTPRPFSDRTSEVTPTEDESN